MDGGQPGQMSPAIMREGFRTPMEPRAQMGGMDPFNPQIPSYGGGAGRFIQNFQMSPSTFQPRTYQAQNVGTGLLPDLISAMQVRNAPIPALLDPGAGVGNGGNGDSGGPGDGTGGDGGIGDAAGAAAAAAADGAAAAADGAPGGGGGGGGGK